MDIPNTDSVNYAFASAQSHAMQYRHKFIKKHWKSVFAPRKNCPGLFPSICRKKWNEFLKI